MKFTPFIPPRPAWEREADRVATRLATYLELRERGVAPSDAARAAGITGSEWHTAEHTYDREAKA
jgi:hypothetical protein